MGDRPVLHRFSRPITSVTALQNAITLHTGIEDVPVNTAAEITRLRRLLSEGVRLEQHLLITSADPHGRPRTVMATGITIAPKTCARLLGLGEKVVLRAIESGVLPTTDGGRLPLTGDGSEDLDAFALRYARWHRFRLLNVPRRRGNQSGPGRARITADDVRAAHRVGLIAARASGDQLFVYTDVHWLRFADQVCSQPA
ncbi:MAG: hypothetical protein AAGG50_11180 [Bacteroidota bacterium]